MEDQITEEPKPVYINQEEQENSLLEDALSNKWKTRGIEILALMFIIVILAVTLLVVTLKSAVPIP